MAQWRDWALQALISEGLPPALDDYDRVLELASVVKLVDIAAHRSLAPEIQNWRSIMETQRSKQLGSC